MTKKVINKSLQLENSYPNPLQKIKKLPQHLLKKRKYDRPPFPVNASFVLAGIASLNYEKDYDEWCGRQIKQDQKGFHALAKHYDLDITHPEFYRRLSLHLARDFVPMFQMAEKKGRQKNWGEQELRLLVLNVYIYMKENNVNRSKAINALSKEGALYEYQGKREGLRNWVIKGEKLLDMSKVESFDVKTLMELREEQEKVLKNLGEDIKRWLGE